ncbi:MAG: hypothetical protein ACOC9Z_04140 [Chloroflexota bacterium]
MELGRLTLLCMNLVCVGTIVSLVFVLLISLRPPEKKRPRIYSEPPVQRGRDVLKPWRNPEEDAHPRGESSRRIEV